ncbi:hypothetical protein HanXRQr2_Chr16g0756151 [Helianthus annuus]|uniref:Uncharacterized protein n=1 Tax=Helianthus annuus TaxID=4232 RepID=A0A9K3DTF8_HELAN|nr:uncharacterized protein LOC110916512 [Helianthus annuus]KAF5760670.1 hypothetical protein HanXRQr2_Chr16g0756151 [Helianthus annuus]KAJ0438661.1 hypothetical protein HanHA300_Chr16g0616601 [Helianthus annuus]KAJ0443514.1 hypothetical protein HanIR_Chr16g0821601 [Helianthus annuus]KAJ0461009.1 hypothetical protein HanHA89_Chr16g0667461 [Helianthus annuus]KAJ0641436.1 hypothetical protein HanLR1_Chr16g0627191 [Helianthus annuus]
MGCCASTHKPHGSPDFHRHSSRSSRAPPPVEEETVKEVLSETPNPNHFNKIQDEPRKTTPRNSLHKIRNQQNFNHEENNFSGEVSEICSNMSETVSNTTFEEDFEVSRRKVANRSPAKLRNRQHNNNSGELRTVKNINSPVRGKQQSPGRVRSGSEINNRGSGFGSTGRQRPGSGQASRSRSPANRTVARGGGGGGRNGVGRSPSVRKMDSSPGRVGAVLPQRVMDLDMGSGMEREEESGWAPMDGNDESLDNPLVSLECFIFL